MKKKQLTMKVNEGPIPDGLAQGVDRTCDLILECFDCNNISKSEGVSAMASMLVNILLKNPESFRAIMQMMQISFEAGRKEIGLDE